MSGLVTSQALAGLVSAGILKGMNGVTHLEAWRWLFILEGLFTAVLAVAAFFILPNYPATAKWLSENEKVSAMARLAEDIGSEDSIQEEISMMKALAMAGKDYRVWFFACLPMVRICEGSRVIATDTDMLRPTLRASASVISSQP